jgi:G3E family GTPase
MRAPLVLLTGFLGAGKTSLLQRVIPPLGARGLRPVVILNDHRNARVDAARLASLQALVTPINGDCVCCESRDALFDALLQVPMTPGTIVLIEANGATDAEELLGALTMDTRLRDYAPPTQVAIVDALRWQKRHWHNALETDQVATASHLWMNWTERVDAVRLAEVKEEVEGINGRAHRVTPESLAEILGTLSAELADAPPRRRALPTADAGGEAHHGHGHDHAHEHASLHVHQHHFASVELPIYGLVSREAFMATIAALPADVVRAKGLVRFADAPTLDYVWSRIGGDPTVYLDPVPRTPLAPIGIFIGAALDVSGIAAALQLASSTSESR